MYYAITDPYASETSTGFANTKSVVCFNSSAVRNDYCRHDHAQRCTRREAEQLIASNCRRANDRRRGQGIDENFGATEMPTIPFVQLTDGRWVPER